MFLYNLLVFKCPIKVEIVIDPINLLNIVHTKVVKNFNIS